VPFLGAKAARFDYDGNRYGQARELAGVSRAEIHPVATDITYLITYACPGCNAALQTTSDEADSWLRCPKCGQPSMPPDDYASSAQRTEGQDILYLGADGSIRPPMTSARHARTAQISGLRIALLLGLLMGVSGLVAGILGQAMVWASLGGLTTVLFLGLLAIPPKRS
jgi:hypothetical protein